MKRVILLAFLALIGTAAGYVFLVLPAQVEKGMNTTLKPPPYEASPNAKALHRQLVVADLHADTLLWNRDLLDRGGFGHLDVPRLIEGNVALQGFTIVTKTPRNMNIDRNDDSTDNITLLSIVERWPIGAWGSLTARALHQAGRLHEAAARSNGRLTVITTSGDLDRYLQRRATDANITAGFLGVEGAHALEGRLDNLEALFEAGIRMLAPTHLFDNGMGGSAHGVNKGGLTDSGRELIRRMESRKMLVDLAHASAKTFDDAVAMARRPIVVSHTGVTGTCDNARNLTDDQLRAVARTGGVVGIGYWETATCGTDVQAIARAIGHAVKVAGIDHVGLGSDFDGAVPEPFDTTGVLQITGALIAEGFSESEIRAVMGGNVIRLLRTQLP
jgi:membrane dipeptidase